MARRACPSMTRRPAVRAVLCLAALFGGLVLAALYPEAGAHLGWAGLTLAVAIFLLDPPTIRVHVGRKAAVRETEQTSLAARLQERAHVLDLKDHALREQERRVREREAFLDAKAAAVLSRENHVQAAWVRLRAEQERLGERSRGSAEPRAGAVAMRPEDWLGVAPGASQEEVRQAWISLAKAYHPDRLRGLPAWARDDGERRMKAINEAYEALRR